MLRTCAVALLALVALTLPARADVQGHCEAYAVDFASALAPDGPVRQHKYDIALAGCLAEYSPAAVAAATPVAKPAAAAPELQGAAPTGKSQAAPAAEPETPAAAKPEVTVAAAQPASGKPEARNGLKPGSPEWKAYCASKYTSFDPGKGTYTSRTGVVRPCLVTRTRAPY